MAVLNIIMVERRLHPTYMEEVDDVVFRSTEGQELARTLAGQMTPREEIERMMNVPAERWLPQYPSVFLDIGLEPEP